MTQAGCLTGDRLLQIRAARSRLGSALLVNSDRGNVAVPTQEAHQRRLAGTHGTSPETAVVSLARLELDDEVAALWDAPVHTAALRWGA